MSTEQILRITSTSTEATSELGSEVGHRLRGGETIALASDLGGGKTAWVRGLARGAGSMDEVSSPSFTICNQYEAGDLTICHYDFYRLSEAGLIANELHENLSNPKAVIVIEWADVIEDVLPSDIMEIKIKSINENERELTYEYPNSMLYLIGSI